MRPGGQLENLRFGIVLALLAATFLMGGGSRLDVSSLFILQPLAAVAAVVFLLTPRNIEWRAVRAPMLFLAALSGIMAAQLIPLPPAIWTNLPGHAPFAETAVAAGLQQPWRTMSLTPDLTLASLVGLVVPAAVLLGYASIDRGRRQLLLLALLIGVGASAVLALLQLTGGSQSPFYTYRITNEGSAVGLFANRNHQAVLVAMAWPMLTVWAGLPRSDRRQRAATWWIAAGFALFLLPLLLVTGSRSGLVLGVIGLVCAGIIWRSQRQSREHAESSSNPLATVAIAGGALALIAATVMLSRAEAIQRVLDLDAGGDSRTEAVPTLLTMAWDFFPTGAGLGSFDPIFRSYEPLELLNPLYLNHAHNDLLELAITAGLPGIALLVGFLAWFAVQGVRAWRNKALTVDVALARVGSVIIGLALLSSLVDYPLRTSLMMVIFAIACGWLGDWARDREARVDIG